MSVSSTLTRAAWYVEHDGLAKGTFHSFGGGGYCAIGAIIQASSLMTDKFEAVSKLFEVVGNDWEKSTLMRTDPAHRYDWEFKTITEWNDRPATTQEQVVEALRKAAENA